MASPLPSLEVSKRSAVNEFLGWLIEKMAEVGTRSSMTSNQEIIIILVKPAGSSTCPLNYCCSVYSCYRVGLAITFRAVDTQMKCLHTKGLGERSEPHSLYLKQTLTVYYNPTPKNRHIQCHHKQCTLIIISINTLALSGICKYTWPCMHD